MDETQAQIRAARALLGWTQERLAMEAGVGLATLKRYEKGETVRAIVLPALVNALRAVGIIFITDQKLGRYSVSEGVAIRKNSPSK